MPSTPAPALAAPQGDPPPIAQATNLTKVYGAGSTTVRALDGIDVAFARGQFTAIMGPSGSGKSTLMHCMAGLDSPTSGTIVVDGMTISRMKERELTRLRRNHIGFVFQAFNLVPTLTAQENITLPLNIARTKVDRAWFDQVVETLGLRDRLTHRPAELSGGQQQRVACARALVSKPAVIFADEPTGNLDSRSSGEVLAFLRRSVDELGQTVIMVTHDAAAAAHSHRALFLGDGHIVGELAHPSQDAILQALRSLSAGAPPDAAPRLGADNTSSAGTTPATDSGSSADSGTAGAASGTLKDGATSHAAHGRHSKDA